MQRCLGAAERVLVDDRRDLDLDPLRLRTLYQPSAKPSAKSSSITLDAASIKGNSL